MPRGGIRGPIMCMGGGPPIIGPGPGPGPLRRRKCGGGGGGGPPMGPMGPGPRIPGIGGWKGICG